MTAWRAPFLDRYFYRLWFVCSILMRLDEETSVLPSTVLDMMSGVSLYLLRPISTAVRCSILVSVVKSYLGVVISCKFYIFSETAYSFAILLIGCIFIWDTSSSIFRPIIPISKLRFVTVSCDESFLAFMLSCYTFVSLACMSGCRVYM